MYWHGLFRRKSEGEFRAIYDVLSRWFGYRNYAEGGSIISKLKLPFKQESDLKDEVMLMDYICGAMK